MFIFADGTHVAHFFRSLIMAGILSAFSFSAFSADALKEMSAMPGISWRGTIPAPTDDERALAERMKKHVVAIASQEHNVSHFSRLEAAAAYLEKTLAGYGYQPGRQELTASGRRVRNIEVSIKPLQPEAAKPGLVVVGAHYDSAIGALGADDNASGTAAVVELARLLKDAELPADKEIRLVLFVNEEAPYFGTSGMGSWTHAQTLHQRGEKVTAMISLETIGYFSDEKGSQRYPPPLASIYPDTGDFIGFVGNTESRTLLERAIASFRRHTAFPSEGLIASTAIPGVGWSDHWSYWQFGYPAIMVTDTAPYRYPYYHTPQDTPDKIDYLSMARVVKGMERVIRELAGSK